MKATIADQPIDATVATKTGRTVVTMPAGRHRARGAQTTVLGAAIKEPGSETTVMWRLLQVLSLPVEAVHRHPHRTHRHSSGAVQRGPPMSPGSASWGGGTRTRNPFNDGPRGWVKWSGDPLPVVR